MICQPIPVAPAAHYHMGGIAADVDGRTSLRGLYAVGECAATGLHGANRLASNSLLEAAVCGDLAGKAARGEADPGTTPLPTVAAPELSAAGLKLLREVMAQDAGVLRDRAGLTRLLTVIDGLEAVHGRALALVAARLIAEAALARKESRGAHFRSDFPCMTSPARRTSITLDAAPVEPAREPA